MRLRYRVEQVSDTMRLIRPKHWWQDLAYRDVLAALVELSQDYRVLSVANIGSGLSGKFLVVIDAK